MAKGEAHTHVRWAAGQDRVVAAGDRRLMLSGEFDASNAHEIEAAVEALGVVSECILDCSSVLYMDSSALHVLIKAARKLASSGGRLVIESPTSYVVRILEVSGIARDADILVRDGPDLLDEVVASENQ